MPTPASITTIGRSRRPYLLAPFLLVLAGSLFAADFTLAPWKCAPLKLACERVHDMGCEATPAGGYEVTTSGPDAYIFAANLPAAYDPNRSYVLALEYKTDGGTSINAYCQSPGKTTYLPIANVKPASEWTWLLCDLSLNGKPRGPLEWLRLGFRGGSEAKHISLRNVRLAEADEQLHARAALGIFTEAMPSFGIAPPPLAPRDHARETTRLIDQSSATVVATLYPPLDFHSLTREMQSDPSAKALVPLAPALVCGEGPHPDNHTVIRILSRYQVPETQFLAFPPEITGGVGVSTLKLADGSLGFAAWPLSSDQTSEIRLFNRAGGLVRAIAVPASVSPPFSLCTGHFLSSAPGQQIAVASRHAHLPAPILLYQADGQLLQQLPSPASSPSADCVLVAKPAKPGAPPDALLVEYPASRQYFAIDTATRVLPFTGAPGNTLFPSAYDDRAYNAAGPEPLLSTLLRVDETGGAVPLDAGRMENIFWYCLLAVHAGDPAHWQVSGDGKYVKNGVYNFLSDAASRSPLAKTGDIEDKSYPQWIDGVAFYDTGDPLPKNLSKYQRQLSQYDTGMPAVWSLIFTHRWGLGAFDKLMAQLDPATGLPRYLVLNRANQRQEGGYFDKILFRYGSQNFQQESLTAFYHNVQREYFKRLAPRFRANPEKLIAVEASHENEIVSGPHSVGDYNTKSIEGFYQYLLDSFGSLSGINRVFHTPFTDSFFDAPRGLFRGPWDDYSSDNPYFAAWVEYGRTTVYRRVAVAQRETLLAGFPPELIKSHQIPDTFAINNIGTGEGEPRITPIDWFLTAGDGFGFSRYGLDYKKPFNIHQAAHSSGFDGMLIGEYASLTPSLDDALGQLLYIRVHGVSTLHVMWWPTYEKGASDFNLAQDGALQRLLHDYDTPRPGYTGGIGQIRPYRGAAGAFDIASLGMNPANTGLIKSLRADGSFEGTVYVTPFHAHVAITTLKSAATISVPSARTKLCDLPPLRAGSLIELTATTPDVLPQLEISLTHDGIPLPGAAITLKDLAAHQAIRIVYKVPLVLDEVALHFSSPGGPRDLTDLRVYHHQDQTISLTRNISDASRHQCGVTFDVLE